MGIVQWTKLKEIQYSITDSFENQGFKEEEENQILLFQEYFKLY